MAHEAIPQPGGSLWALATAREWLELGCGSGGMAQEAEEEGRGALVRTATSESGAGAEVTSSHITAHWALTLRH